MTSPSAGRVDTSQPAELLVRRRFGQELLRRSEMNAAF